MGQKNNKKIYGQYFSHNNFMFVTVFQGNQRWHGKVEQWKVRKSIIDR